MNFAWKFVLPMTLLNLMVAVLWRFMGEGLLRWVACSAVRCDLCSGGTSRHAKQELRTKELSLCGIAPKRCRE